MTDLSEIEINKNDIQELQVSLNQNTFQNVMAEDFLNTHANVNTQVTVHEAHIFTVNHLKACIKKKD
jgi:hypothetical protein